MSFEFNLPALNNLSRDQQNAVFKKLSDEDCVIVSGCPGSGKTTVVTFRMHRNQKTGVNYQYLVYAKLLQRFLVNQFRANNLDETRVATIMRWYYNNSNRDFLLSNDQNSVRPSVRKNVDTLAQRLNLKELMLDEGQDLPVELLSIFSNLASRTFICADMAQDVFGRTSHLGSAYLETVKRNLDDEGKNVYHIHLTKNFRNTENIYAFANSCAPNINAAHVESFARSKGEVPKLFIFENQGDMLSQLVKSIKDNPTMNIGVLSTSRYKVDLISRNLDSKKISHTRYHSKEVPDDISFKKVVVTTFHSCKGLEFDMVIIPFADSISFNDESELKRVYVGMTRAKERLRLLTASDILPTFVQRVEKDLYEIIR